MRNRKIQFEVFKVLKLQCKVRETVKGYTCRFIVFIKILRKRRADIGLQNQLKLNQTALMIREWQMIVVSMYEFKEYLKINKSIDLECKDQLV